MASSKIPHTNTYDIILTSSGTNIADAIVDNWDKFPHGSPFIAKLWWNGDRICFGYIYPAGNYGQVVSTELNNNVMYMVRCYNNTFSKTVFSGSSV